MIYNQVFRQVEYFCNKHILSQQYKMEKEFSIPFWDAICSNVEDQVADVIIGQLWLQISNEVDKINEY